MFSEKVEETLKREDALIAILYEIYSYMDGLL